MERCLLDMPCAHESTVDNYTRAAEDGDSQCFVIEGVRALEAPRPELQLTGAGDRGPLRSVV